MDSNPPLLTLKSGARAGAPLETSIGDERDCSISIAVADALVRWYERNARPLPWRAAREPYQVWISEVMLQQTRVETVIPYFARFMEALPSVAALASCPEDALLKLWEGLGYYSRARNLLRAAQKIEAEHGGVFPNTYASIRALPGIGDYTAGAIASICFDLPTPAIDGNVLRVCARLLHIEAPVEGADVRKGITAALESLYARGTRTAPENSQGFDGGAGERNALHPHCPNPGALTQAWMELGETVCLPRAAARCDACPLSALCLAARCGSAARLPIRAPKKARREVRVLVLLLRKDGKLALRKRPRQGLLAGLWEFPSCEAAPDAREHPGDRDNLSAPDATDARDNCSAPDAPGAADPLEAVAAFARELGVRPLSVREGPRRTHIFTHIQWDMQSYLIDCAADTPGATANAPNYDTSGTTPDAPGTPPDAPNAAPLEWATPEEIARRYALPSAFRPFLGIAAASDLLP